MPQIRMQCRTPEGAAHIVAETGMWGSESNTLTQDGNVVIIDYHDSRLPADAADDGRHFGHVTKAEAARVTAAAKNGGEA